jgi:proline iminopeptidase
MRVAVNGTNLFFDVNGARFVPDGPAMREQPTILLLHGGPGFDHSIFKPDFDWLSDRAQVVYLDHRGNGRSDRDDPERWNLEQWGDDVRAFCDAVGIERPIVWGWSFGGMVAQSYVARHPDHPAALVLQSTAARMDLDRLEAAFTRVGGEEAGRTARAFWENPTPEGGMEYLQKCIPVYSPNPQDLDGITRCQLNFDLLNGWTEGRTMDLRPGLGSVRCPTLVLAGDLDPVTPREAADEIIELLPNDVTTVARFEKSGHFIHTDEPDAFRAATTAFLDGL